VCCSVYMCVHMYIIHLYTRMFTASSASLSLSTSTLLSFSLYFSLACSLALSVSLARALALSRPLSFSPTGSFLLTFSPSLSLFLVLSLSFSLTHSLLCLSLAAFLSLSLSPSPSLPHIHTLIYTKTSADEGVREREDNLLLTSCARITPIGPVNQIHQSRGGLRHGRVANEEDRSVSKDAAKVLGIEVTKSTHGCLPH